MFLLFLLTKLYLFRKIPPKSVDKTIYVFYQFLGSILSNYMLYMIDIQIYRQVDGGIFRLLVNRLYIHTVVSCRNAFTTVMTCGNVFPPGITYGNVFLTIITCENAFSYLSISSVRKKFENLKKVVSNHVDIL